MASWTPLIYAPLALVGWACLALIVFDGRPRGLRGRLRRSRLGRWSRLRYHAARTWLGRGASERRLRERGRGADEELNRLTTPPPQERLEWVALWMVEVYAPSHVPRLIEGLRDLGWDKRRADFNDVVSWLRDARGSGRTQSFSLGPMVRESSPIGFRGQTVPLGERFDAVVPSFVQLPSGVTVLIAQFTIAPSSQRCLETALREDGTAEVRRLGEGRHSLVSAAGAKSERLARVREVVRGEAAEWMGRLAPGASAESGEEMASWDLIVTAESELWSGQRERGWLDTAGYGMLERWRSERVPTSLCIPRWSNESSARPTFAATAGRVRAERAGRTGSGEDPGHLAFAAELSEDLGLVLSLLGLREAIQGYERRFSALRDLKVGTRLALLRAPRQLRRLQTQGLPMAADADALRRSAAQVGDGDQGLSRLLGGVEFRYVPEAHETAGDADATLESWLASTIEEEAGSAAQTGEAAVGGLRAIGDILLARTNLQLQLLIVVLTIVVSVLSYLTLRSAEDSSAPPTSTSEAGAAPQRVVGAGEAGSLHAVDRSRGSN